jgi:hypothetical protein
LHVGSWEGKEARAIGARGTNFGIKWGGEKLARGWTFDGQAGAIEKYLGCRRGATRKVE